MTEGSNNIGILDNDILEEIIKKLTDFNFMSIFFLLMDRISPGWYLTIIKKDRNQKEMALKELIKCFPSRDLLIELLWTIKRYDLLKLFKECHHKFQYCSFSSLNRMWKSVYEICYSFEKKNDMKYLKKAFGEVSVYNEDELEIFFAKAYNDKKISDDSLVDFLDYINRDNIRSKTWALRKEFYAIRSPTEESPCGLAIIINHENFEDNELKLKQRKDSPLDVADLKSLWESFGFKVETYLNLKAEEVLLEFKKLSEKDFSTYDVFVACYMSHGNKGIVYSSDCKPIEIDCLVDLMANKCKTLLDKPKLFFIQACQGTVIQCDSSQILSALANTDSNLIQYQSFTNLFVDVLVAVSSIPGFVSFAADGKNSWFVEALVKNMKQYGDELSILDVLVKVNNDVSKKIGTLDIQGEEIKCKQTVEQKVTLRKSVQLKKLRRSDHLDC